MLFDHVDTKRLFRSRLLLPLCLFDMLGCAIA